MTERKKRKKSDILSGLGTSFEFMKRLCEQLQDKGGGDTELRAIANEFSCAHEIAELIMAHASFKGMSFTSSFGVDRSEPLEQVFARIRFESFESDPGEWRSPVEKYFNHGSFTIFTAKREMTGSKAVHYLRKLGHRPAGFREAVKFTVHNRKLAKEGIIALGARCYLREGGPWTPMFFSDGDSGVCVVAMPSGTAGLLVREGSQLLVSPFPTI